MKIYNTLTGKKEDFETLVPGKVKMYVCGLTVYDLMHIGNARTLVDFDAVRRYLLYKGFDVSYVLNYTDIDDRIIKKARDEVVSISEITERYIAEAQRDFAGLNIQKPSVSPRVTQELSEITDMTESLIGRGCAYEKNGSVYFRAASFPGYGKLSKKNTEDLTAGARVEVNEEKENAADFVLWKAAKENEPAWNSPWGMGRPGWHIECSVMAKKYLGETIDIHAGGEDLIFPHHENEIAQSESANQKPFARYWLHARHVNVNNRKMAKSEGNFFTVREVAEKYSYEIIRFYVLSNHYRSPINFSEELIEASKNAYNRIKNCVFSLSHMLKENKDLDAAPKDEENIRHGKQYLADFIKAMDDDFNTADAITAIFEYVRFANSTASEESPKVYVQALLDGITELCGILGINIVFNGEGGISDAEIEGLIAERQDAKKAKDFKRADEIRDKLLDMGIALLDTRQGVRFLRDR